MPSRKKAVLYDVVERIIAMYHDDKLEIRAIESRLRDEGIDISRSAIHRTLKDNQKGFFPGLCEVIVFHPPLLLRDSGAIEP